MIDSVAENESPIQRRFEPLAVIGTGCRLPGAANVDEFWQMLVNGRSGCGTIPDDRLDKRLYFDPEKGHLGKTYTLAAATFEFELDSLSRLPLPVRATEEYDRGHLSYCGTVAEALRDAGYDPCRVEQPDTGVFLGHTHGSDAGGRLIFGIAAKQTLDLFREIEGAESLTGMDSKRLHEFVSTTTAAVRAKLQERGLDESRNMGALQCAQLVSRTFGFRGPSLVVNAACASALQALAIAARALTTGRIRMAVVGGASYCGGSSLVLFSKAQSVATQESCPFDERADGLVAAEGHVSLVIKTLDQARRDGDDVIAVIRGIGVSSDGKGKSLWAPRKEGQIKAVERAYADGIDPSYLQFVEAHATSTQVGDATEMQALIESLRPAFGKDQKIPIASVKANIGHTLETAGMAGLLKVILALKHRAIPRQIQIRKLNPRIDWDQAPFYVPLENEDWKPNRDGRPRLAAVNAFGIGGLNTHVVVEEPVNDSPSKTIATVAPARGDSIRNSEPIAVVGCSVVLPGAKTLDEYWSLLCSTRDPKSDVSNRWRPDLNRDELADQNQTVISRGGYQEAYEYDWRKHRVPPREIASANPLQFMILDSVDQALASADVEFNEAMRQRAAVVVGSQFGSDFADEMQLGIRIPEMQQALREELHRRGVDDANAETLCGRFRDTVLKRFPALTDETGSFTTSTLASRITKMFDLMGGAFALDAGAASSGMALATAVDLLRCGDVDMVICAAGQRSMGLATYRNLSRTGGLASNSDESRFSPDSDGFLPGEGAGVLILQRVSDARAHQRKIFSIIEDVEVASSQEPNQAMRLAASRLSSTSRTEHEQSQRNPATDSQPLVELASIGRSIDRECLSSITKEIASDSNVPAIAHSVVGRIGQCDGGSGMAALIAALLQVQHRTLLADFPANHSPSSIEFKHGPIHVLQEGQVEDERPIHAWIADSDTSGVATITKLVKELAPLKGSRTQFDRATRLQSVGKRESRWFFFEYSAASRQELATRLANGPTPKPSSNLPLQGRRTGGASRLILIAESEAHAQMVAKRAAALLEANASAADLLHHGVVFIDDTKIENVAIFFGGGATPSSRWNDDLRKIAGQVQRQPLPARSNEVGEVESDLILAERLLERIPKPSFVLGHGVGFVGALYMANAISARTALRLQSVWRRAASDSSMASAMISHHQSRFADQLNDLPVSLSSLANGLSLLTGHQDSVQEALGRIRPFVNSVKLHANEALHCRALQDQARRIEEELRATEIHPAAIPILSELDHQFYSDPGWLIEHAARSICEPIDLHGALDRTLSLDPDLLIEIGPGSTLLNRYRSSLGKTSTLLLSLDHQAKGPLHQWYCLEALIALATSPHNKPSVGAMS